MEHWVYEKDYESEYEAKIQANCRPTDDLLMEEIKKTKVLKEIEKSMQECPRVLSENKRKKYDCLFQRLDAHVKQYGGKIKAEISDEEEGGKIVAELPFWEFWGGECPFMLETLALADYVLIEPEGEKVKLLVRVWFFEYSMSEQERIDLIEDEIRKHPKLMELLKKYKDPVK